MAYETDRLEALRDYGVLDTPPEPKFDQLTGLAAELFGVPIALISLVDESRQWFKSRQGLTASETPREQAFCAHALDLGRDGVLVVPDASQDARFECNPLVTGEPAIRFYAGAALTTPSGFNLGTLCVIDTKPRQTPDEHQLAQLQTLARMVVEQLEQERTKKTLQDKARLLMLAEAMSGVGHWRYDVARGRVSWSDEVYRIHGVTPDTFDPNYDATVSFYHPDDQAVVDGFVRHGIETGVGFAFQLRLIRRDGQMRNVSARAECEVDPVGRTSAIIGVFQDITDHVFALESALQNEARYRMLADHASDMVIRYGRSGVITYASPSCAAMGIQPENFIGKSIVDFVPPDERSVAVARLEALFGPDSALQPPRSLARAVRGDGTLIWIEGHPNVLKDAMGRPIEIINSFRDMTEQKLLEDQLSVALRAAEEATAKAQQSETRYRTMSDISLDMIARVDMDATIRFVSPSSYIVLGFTPEELIGTTTISHMHPEDVPGVARFFQSLRAAGPSAAPKAYRYRARRKDGDYIWLEGIPRILFDAEGQPLEIQDSARDVTERTELERELSKARAVAESAAAAKAEFLANMSHELRTPLNSIIGFSQLLTQSTALSPTDERHAELIAMSSNGLLAIVNDILDFSSLEGGGIRLDHLPFSVHTAVRRSIDGLQVQADAKNLALDFAIDDDVAAQHLGDKARLNQILINLVNNAIKFTPSGCVDVRVRAIDAGAKSQKLRFEIRDTGIGIRADQQSALFTRFSQVDSSISRRFGGTGLGLAITHHLVSLMGGTIGVESVENQGSVFWFEIALPAAAQETSYKQNRHTTGVPLTHRRILVVDDVDLNRELALALLAGSGGEVEVAAGGGEAVRMAGANAYDVIFMDVQMPDMDGMTATRAIRASSLNADVPIIAMTAQALPKQIAACHAAGMNDHIAKPIARDGLQAMVRKWAPNKTATSPPPVETDLLSGLRVRFVERSAGDLARIQSLLAHATDRDAEEMKMLVHRLAGTAGTFGFQTVGEAALAIDQRFAEEDAPDPDDYAPLLTALAQMCATA